MCLQLREPRTVNITTRTVHRYRIGVCDSEKRKTMNLMSKTVTQEQQGCTSIAKAHPWNRSVFQQATNASKAKAPPGLQGYILEDYGGLTGLFRWVSRKRNKMKNLLPIDSSGPDSLTSLIYFLSGASGWLLILLLLFGVPCWYSRLYARLRVWLSGILLGIFLIR